MATTKEMKCASCGKAITDQFALAAIDRLFHHECLKCACCQFPLAELSRIFYHRQGLLLCARDYMRLFGRTGICAGCECRIAAFEYVVRAKDSTFHLDCFQCAECGERFCVGDKFLLKGTKVYCRRDFPVESGGGDQRQ